MGVLSARIALGVCLFACSPTTPPPARPATALPDATPAAAPADDALAARGDRTPAPDEGDPSSRPAERASARFPSGSLALDHTWADCVKDFVDAQRSLAREPLIDALSVYFTTCDRVERRIVVEAPRPVPSGHDYAFESHISFGAHLTRAQQRVWLEVTYHGDTRIMAERIKVAADDFRWTSPPLTFERDVNKPSWESAEMPYTRQLQGIVRKIVDAKESIVRFEGPRTHGDLIVTEEMKQDLRLMMDALGAIKLP
jgi:hypothetical protein